VLGVDGDPSARRRLAREVTALLLTADERPVIDGYLVFG
jgi:hypothetical protein